MAKKKILNLDLNAISVEDLVNLCEIVEKSVRAYLREKLPAKEEFDLVVSVEKDDKITITVDIGIVGRYSGLIDYEAVIGDAINYARRVLESELEKFRRTRTGDQESSE